MSLKNKPTALLAATAVLLVATGAAAAAWTTSSYTIKSLETTLSERPYRVKVTGSIGSDLNPHGCTDVSQSYLEPHPNISGALDKDHVSSVLLSAHLGGRPVKFYLSGTECTTSNGTNTTSTNGRPTFTAVSIE